MKDETLGVLIKDFAWLTFIIYTFITEDNHKSIKARGVNKNVVDTELIYEDFKNILFNGLYMIRLSKDHNAGLYGINETSLSSYNDKNIYLNIDIVYYHIFINLLLNHIKKISSDVDNFFNFFSRQSSCFIQNFSHAIKK